MTSDSLATGDDYQMAYPRVVYTFGAKQALAAGLVGLTAVGCLSRPLVSDSETEAGPGTGEENDTDSAEASTNATTTTTTTSTSPATTSDPSASTTVVATTGPGPTSGSATFGSGSTAGSACLRDPRDDECDVCTKEVCCEELIECDADRECRCLIDCIEAMGLPELAVCQGACDIVGLPSTALQLAGCQGTMCGDNGC